MHLIEDIRIGDFLYFCYRRNEKIELEPSARLILGGIMKIHLILISAAFFLTACNNLSNSNKNNELNPHLRFARNLISNRPQNTKNFIAVLKLKNPALLENAKIVNGRPEIDETQLTKINEEQQAVEKELKALSPKVQIIFKYKMVLNGLAVLAPIELESKIKNLAVVAYAESSGQFSRPLIEEISNSFSNQDLNERNSVKFIGAENLNSRGIKGRGVRVGVIDTGIDYTHSMLGGVGTEEAYLAVNPSTSNAGFPNSKVVGGVDLVGSKYNAASPDFNTRLPMPDMNPLDEAGHGTHVAGTVAGIGDGVSTYNGVAPEADLYAIKVFGAEGSTSDYVVIAALEYSADPNADGNATDQLDVVNLSLGSSYGNPAILYGEAVKNLVNGGTVVVASAGNSGHKDYIVGAPGTSDSALSVAASVDNADHLWKFNASRINLAANESILVEAIEAATSRKISEGSAVAGELVYIGLAAEDLTPDLASAVRGKVALIDRGAVSFNDKLVRAAKAGAIGAVVANNKEGAAISMGTTDEINIPAIMITLADAVRVKSAIAKNSVVIEFRTGEKIERPELIDTLTDFTSKGPRSFDGHIKPEIAAPGENVISAAMGKGNKATQMSGTSMAAPHMAGVMALLKQAKPELSAKELKSVAMAGSKIINREGLRYPVSMQGAGRVRADISADLKLVSDLHSVSLGQVGVEEKKMINRELKLKNLTVQDLNLEIDFIGSENIKISRGFTLIKPGETLDLNVAISLDATGMKNETVRELDGWIVFKENGKEIYKIPVLAVANKLSAIEAKSLVVNSTSERDSSGASAELILENMNQNQGAVILFNHIGNDDRKPKAPSYMSADCDLQTAGYRLIKGTKHGESDILEFAVKLYKPVTTWHACDISLMIDANGDGVAEQELLGSNTRSIGSGGDRFVTTLIDAAKMREIRKKYEAAIEKAQGDASKIEKIEEDYTPSIIEQRGMLAVNNSTVAILAVSADKLASNREGAISFKVIVSHNEQSTVEFDDHLQSTSKVDMKISLRKEDQSFVGLRGAVEMSGPMSISVPLVKGDGREDLLVLMPFNRFSQSNLHSDSQSAIIKPEFITK
jgi:minor extracellular serine protease Vpr